MVEFSIRFNEKTAFTTIAEMFMNAKYGESEWYELHWVHLVTWDEYMLLCTFCDQINIQIKEV